MACEGERLWAAPATVVQFEDQRFTMFGQNAGRKSMEVNWERSVLKREKHTEEKLCEEETGILWNTEKRIINLWFTPNMALE